jgi:Uma2 family endonuclease
MIALTPPQKTTATWQPATWADYEQYRDRLPDRGRHRIYYHNGYLKADDMGWEGIRHSEVRELFALILGIWFITHPDQTATSLGGCLMEKQGYQAAAPDLVLYVGEGAPSWEPGEKRRIDLNQCRIPDLVGEVADTSLADDLNPMKELYAALGIPEYWIIDTKAYKIFAFQLQPNGTYEEIESSNILSGLPIMLLQQTLDRLTQDTNITAAQWFMQAIGGLGI